ncbi:DUF2306 domain-containing protein [Lentisalinibacter salinarum]|uniref:hypothetical protein n=1 Tax=Lentisalinibacter salinarum TaxID=2992239 RepID=UPI003867E974
MTTLHSLLVNTHVAIGAIALLLFWVPAFARKGSPLHVGAGRVYVVCMYAVAVTAFVASLMMIADPLGIRFPQGLPVGANAGRVAAGNRAGSLFLLMLSVLVTASVRHGTAALRERRHPGELARPLHRILVATLGVLAVISIGMGLWFGHLLLIIFGGIGLLAAIGMFRETQRRDMSPRELVVVHLNGLIGSGIGAYTAFFAFGGRSFLGEVLPGQWQVIPWILPTVIGVIAGSRISRRWLGQRGAGQRAPEPQR